jgi:hypothetical protein
MKKKKTAELVVANTDLLFKMKEKIDAAELIIANTELLLSK